MNSFTKISIFFITVAILILIVSGCGRATSVEQRIYVQTVNTNSIVQIDTRMFHVPQGVSKITIDGYSYILCAHEQGASICPVPNQ